MTASRRKSAHALPLIERRRLLVAGLGLAGLFAAEATQLGALAISGGGRTRQQPIEPFARSIARPDIVDRTGRLIATDIATPSLFADPSRVIDVDETAEKLATAFPALEASGLRRDLGDKNRHFLWLKRGLDPDEEKTALELGLPGVAFRTEPRRVYPIGQNAAQTIGFVDIENRGAAGIERWIDAMGRSETVDGPGRSSQEPIVLSLDLAVQHALRQELAKAIADTKAEAAAGVVLDVRTGEVIAASSLPDFLTGDAQASLLPATIDRLTTGSYELGSVFKTVTLAAAHEAGVLTPGKLYDARLPIRTGGQEIDDFHPTRRLLDAAGVFLHSSNIGAAKMATEVGEIRLRSILARLGLTEPQATELGQGPRPLLPVEWRPVSTMTIAFGHGIAVTPLQFAAAMATLVNGGQPVAPTFLKRAAPAVVDAAPVIGEATVGFMRDLLRRNVTSPDGTGGKADVPGYEVGGKTGTADILGDKGYAGAGVLTSFLATFPASNPRYVTFVLLWRPQATPATQGSRTAGANAAPLTGRLITRIAPILGLAPGREAARAL